MMKLKAPPSLKAEHDKLNQKLLNATHLPDKTSKAAKDVEQLLHTLLKRKN